MVCRHPAVYTEPQSKVPGLRGPGAGILPMKRCDSNVWPGREAFSSCSVSLTYLDSELTRGNGEKYTFQGFWNEDPTTLDDPRPKALRGCFGHTLWYQSSVANPVQSAVGEGQTITWEGEHHLPVFLLSSSFLFLKHEDFGISV